MLLPFSTTILSKPLQPLKASEPIDVTAEGMVSVPVRLLQPSKAMPPISITELGMVTAVRPLQPSKAP